MKLRTFLLFSSLSLVLFVGITLISARLPFPMPEQAVAGKLVWQRHNCISCHSLFGNGGYAGEDLTHITGQETPSFLVNYLIKPPVIPPNKYTHHPGLDKRDAQNLVSYLEFVHTIPTLGWPPEPKKAGKNS
ncbi:Cytochrome c [Desulfosporosinus acidiphilus SJ4]|uniref:Cytochrome c n=1 Tax=Desulfosporosinus acidiphilus (strain DSM 22704 / JCM 16185 / SJ4) TaxID=646529 RepID=I4D2G9_DESAJ|nr:c-type cytochrome [Desulfosporosinus acidiphilus]AFM39993.1 Cytochrome c [Desulfosporosinus acidiphilus SJ4]